jgi:hypothetical protein
MPCYTSCIKELPMFELTMCCYMTVRYKVAAFFQRFASAACWADMGIIRSLPSHTLVCLSSSLQLLSICAACNACASLLVDDLAAAHIGDRPGHRASVV